MENGSFSKRGWIELIGLAILFAAIGSLIIIVFSQYRPLLSEEQDLVGRVSSILILLVAALLARRSMRFNRFGPLLFGLSIMALAVSMDWWIARFMVNSLGTYTNSPAGVALEKAKTGIVITGVVISGTKLSGHTLGSIYVQRGDLKRGLTIGLIAFGVAATASIPMSKLMFAGNDVNLAEALNWAPWIMVAVLANATNEELLFRGLFLRKLEPFFGKFFSNCLIVLVFTGLHLGVTYTQDQMMFLIVVMLLALVWGYITQKTDGVWGSIFFHAGTDIPIFLSIFSTRF